MNSLETNHFHHAMMVAEYGVTFSFHFLPEFSLSRLALWLGVVFFSLYTVISVVHYRYAKRKE